MNFIRLRKETTRVLTSTYVQHKDYTYGLDRIYTRQEIEQAKASPSFEQEYNLKYLGKLGNVFHIRDIEAAIVHDPKEASEMLAASTSTYYDRSMGIDPAWGTAS